MTYRSDIEALAARKVALDAEIKARTQERDEADRVLKDAVEKLRLPVLDNVVIAAPCKANWSNMKGDERMRHCTRCDQAVYDLSAMTREQAESLIREKNGNLCARYYKRADGTIMTKDCPQGTRKRRIGLAIVAGSIGAAAFGGIYASRERTDYVMGSIGFISSLPDECEAYRTEIRELRACEQMPAAAVETLENGWTHLELAARDVEPERLESMKHACEHG